MLQDKLQLAYRILEIEQRARMEGQHSVSLDEGDQLMSTRGKDLRPSLWASSYDSTT